MAARHALAERHGVGFENVTVCAGADAVVGFVCLATLDPGDEVVTGWPSFLSYVLDPLKLGGVPVRVPLRDDRLDLDAMLAAITSRTKLVFIAAPNNPTGTTNSRAELDAYFERVPPHVLTVVDQAYFEYVDDPDYPDAIEELSSGPPRARPAHVLEDLRPRRSAGRLRRRARRRHHGDRQGASRVRRHLRRPGGRPREPRRDRRDRPPPSANRDAMGMLDGVLRDHGLEPTGPAVANFLFVRVGDAERLNEALLRQGVIVRPLGSFGAPDALRITAGTPDEVAFLGDALALSPLPSAPSPSLRARYVFAAVRRNRGAAREPNLRPVAELSSADGRPSRRSSSYLTSCEPP